MSNQRGEALILVLVISSALLILAGTTLYGVRAGLEQSGDQRRGFQALHAGEAGIARAKQTE